MAKLALHRFDQKGLGPTCSGIIGVDEAGRGCFAGPVMAAAVFVPKELYEHREFLKTFKGANDSKQLSADERSYYFEQLQQWRGREGLSWAHAEGSVAEVEAFNIVGATVLAMRRSLEGLPLELPCFEQADDLPLFISTEPIESAAELSPLIWVDGRPLKALKYPHTAWVQGDGKSLAIALASVIAKVTRDRLMIHLHAQCPQYGFNQHKGYGTSMHREAIKMHGPSIHHRLSFLSTVHFDQDEMFFTEK
ncbi:MAG: ribonuclease HII [Verrucomicrobia bacterium 21-51-4]|nr:MAG: ribonuclease HII [Verrucomicrobia bacterium 21-51-4]HQU08329.1 ribonuclease HII [Opitutales bacterium]